MRLASLLFFFALGAAPAALACGFHGYTPEETVVDRMLASDHIVLARPSASDPFRFTAIEALEGSLDGVDIPYLVDSASKRRLAANPDDSVLFAYDDFEDEWRRLAYLDPEYRALIDQIAARIPDWINGDEARRFQMFANLHNHPDSTTRSLALMELDRAEYAILRSLEIEPDADSIRADLGSPSEAHLRSIRLLLIGLSGDVNSRAFLAGGVTRLSAFGEPVLGAYATAWLELDGPNAAHQLANQHLTSAALNTDARELLIEAMAIQSQSGDPATRSAIETELRTALTEAPELAPAVARQFGVRGDWSHRDALKAVLAGHKIQSATDLIAVSQYVTLASDPDMN